MYKRFPLIAGLTLVVAVTIGIDTAAAAGKANWKRGRAYFRMVCSACHIEMTGQPIPPNDHTIAEWTAYMDANKHGTSGKTKPQVSDYTDKAYRESIKDTNKAAKKLLKMSDEALLNDIRAFVIHGAKDSDTPASCN